MLTKLTAAAEETEENGNGNALFFSHMLYYLWHVYYDD